MNGLAAATRVFLSYATEDEEYAARFRQLISEERTGLTFDDCAVRNGFSENWRVSAREKIAACDVVVCLVGEETYCSGPIGWEIEAAITLGKPVFAFSLVPWPVVIPEALRNHGLEMHRLDLMDVIEWADVVR
ncbi:MAG: TIR domain-containing protein [Chloroflexi bacterium]|nr:TIR domain-containing protein [Chloroflexota bacterium]